MEKDEKKIGLDIMDETIDFSKTPEEAVKEFEEKFKKVHGDPDENNDD